jgi:hypothetical protein
LLSLRQRGGWVHGSYDDALTFQPRCFPDRLISMERTSELWVKRKASVEVPTLV